MGLHSRGADVAMVSREFDPEEIRKGAVPFAVARDAVVPVINERHPALAELLSRGITRDELRAIWIGGKVEDWGSLLGSGLRAPIKVYTRDDLSGDARTWLAYLGSEGQRLRGTEVPSAPAMIDAVRADSSDTPFLSMAGKRRWKSKVICNFPLPA